MAQQNLENRRGLETYGLQNSTREFKIAETHYDIVPCRWRTVGWKYVPSTYRNQSLDHPNKINQERVRRKIQYEEYHPLMTKTSYNSGYEKATERTQTVLRSSFDPPRRRTHKPANYYPPLPINDGKVDRARMRICTAQPVFRQTLGGILDGGKAKTDLDLTWAGEVRNTRAKIFNKRTDEITKWQNKILSNGLINQRTNKITVKMGGACCGRKKLEGKVGLQGHRRKNKHRSNKNGIVDGSQSPRPNISSDYTSLPNEFSKRSPTPEKQGVVGLENLGNTWFINSALQWLTNAQPLTDYILSGCLVNELNPSNKLGTGGALTKAFAELVNAQWMDDFESLIPLRLVQVIEKYGPIFADEEQHDSQEFLSFLLDKLHEDLNRAQVRQKQLEIPQMKDQEKMAAKSWQEYLKHNRSVIVDLFQGQLKSSVKCLECEEVSIKFDVFMYLSLPIPKHIEWPTLHQCIQEFTKPEELEESEKWECPKCSRYVKAIKQFDIWKVPPILIVHLKRFEYGEDFVGKYDKAVEYPIRGLDVSKFTTGPQKEKPTYDLFAQSLHEGTLTRGHYTAIARNKNTQDWTLFDDTNTKNISKSKLVQPEQAYLLFYWKSSTAQFNRQSLTQPHLWPHIVGQSFDLEKIQQRDKTSGNEKDMNQDEILQQSSQATQSSIKLINRIEIPKNPPIKKGNGVQKKRAQLSPLVNPPRANISPINTPLNVNKKKQPTVNNLFK